jgi:hypothetical protein
MDMASIGAWLGERMTVTYEVGMLADGPEEKPQEHPRSISCQRSAAALDS